MKRKLALVLTCIATLTLGACGSSASGSPSSQKDSASSVSVKSSSASNIDAAGASTSSSATAKTTDSGDPLMIYSPQADADRVGWLTENAEKALGFDVEFLCAGGNDLADRLVAEKANPQADVVMGLLQTAMYQLKDQDILEPYTPSWADDVSDTYKDKDGYFYEFWQTPIIICYNPDYISDPPTSWQDLIKDEYKGKYSVGTPQGQTIRSYIIGMLWPYYDSSTGEISQDGWDFLSTLYANSYQMPAESDAWQLFKDGTVPIMMTWYDGAKTKSAEYGCNVEYVKPANGTPVVSEGIGIVNGTDQADKAKAYEDWWGSAETQAAYAKQFGVVPVSKKALDLCGDEVKKDGEMFKPQDIDWEVAAEKSNDWFEKIQLCAQPR
ncbi:MAG TPA: ABC transporter substrate-binding protein, partial [Oribacterium sp.]|nr:ABC transporter substrate-binding protein [Oribacterium sp.]